MQVNKDEIIKQYGKSPKDTGQTEVQIALLSEQIKQLAGHFKANPKDNHSRTGLFAHIQKRKKLLKYLKRKHLPRYLDVIKKLSIRG